MKFSILLHLCRGTASFRYTQPKGCIWKKGGREEKDGLVTPPCYFLEGFSGRE